MPKNTTNLMLKDKFNGESEISTFAYSFMFHRNYLSCNISNQNLICKLFSLTFTGQIRKWFNSFTIGSIHSWVQFMEIFIIVHQNYNYDQLYDEIESL